MTKKLNIVVIGGGTGSFSVLQGLKQYAQVSISAIVTMADSGGSTGRLRDEFGYLPVGDVRMALTALASEDDEYESLLRALFSYRFAKGEGLSGHSFGNLLLVALTDILGSETAAITAATKILKSHGNVLPVTEQKADLVATYEDGAVVSGEHAIDESAEDRKEKRITTLTLSPAVSISAPARDAIMHADMIVLGPGDLYTSVLANCVVKGVAEALQKTSAQIVYVCNLMTKSGQTDGLDIAGHVSEIERYIGRSVDAVLANNALPDAQLLSRYALENELPVAKGDCSNIPVTFLDMLATEEVVTVKGDVLKRSLIRHDSKKLAEALLKLVQ